jgi:2-keto-4-pentenoate hydratase/2-oxohepta-3-ene-1,7-dioic acid hydratase in catechol pathway
VHLAAQTLQHFFSGGSVAREHAAYALDEVTLVVPVQHPPSVRMFSDDGSFAFANPAAVVGPGATVAIPAAAVDAFARVVALVADGVVAGLSGLLELRAPGLTPPKDRDFGLVLGPVVVTADEVLPPQPALALGVDGGEWWSGTAPAFDWEGARAFAAAGTNMRTGDLLVGPAAGGPRGVPAGAHLSLAVEGVGELTATLA